MFPEFQANYYTLPYVRMPRTRLAIFTPSRGPFHLSCFLSSFVSRVVSLPARSPSLHYHVVLILQNCRDFIILQRCIFILSSFCPSLPPLSPIYMLSNIPRVSSYSTVVLSLIFMPHRAETLQNCVILLPTVTSIFHQEGAVPSPLPRVLLTFPLPSARSFSYTDRFIIALSRYLIIMRSRYIFPLSLRETSDVSTSLILLFNPLFPPRVPPYSRHFCKFLLC